MVLYCSFSGRGARSEDALCRGDPSEAEGGAESGESGLPEGSATGDPWAHDALLAHALSPAPFWLMLVLLQEARAKLRANEPEIKSIRCVAIFLRISTYHYPWLQRLLLEQALLPFPF
jgi:hypothetical protein